MWSLTAPIGLIYSLVSVSKSPRYFSRILTPEKCHMRTSFTTVKRLLFLGNMALGTLPNCCLTLSKYGSAAYKDWWSKVTANDLRTNVSFLEKSTEVNSSQCKKDKEVGSSRKIQGKERKAPMDDKAP